MGVPDSSSPEPGLIHLDALPAGTRLAEFELRGLLGVGGFGMVYCAYDHSLQRMVAIKEYMPSALASRAGGQALSMRSSADQQGYMAGLQSFLAEARLLAKFDHPSLVKVFRVWEQNNTAYMVMPFYQGMTLKQARTQMRMPPPEAWVRKLLWSLLEALRLLHDHQMVHRDVSPDNIFLQDIGPPVLLDLGAARRAISDRTHKHTAILKVNYAPIEQYADAEDMQQGAWTDLYSLSAVVHGLLCNDTPLPATFRMVRDRMPSMASVAQTVHEQFGLDYTPPFVQAVSQGLAIQPADRPQSAEAFGRLMRLEPPVGRMERFDWRQELGGIWQAPLAAAPAVAADAMAPETTADENLRGSPVVPSAERTQAFGSRTALGAVDAGAVTVVMTSGEAVSSPPARTKTTASVERQRPSVPDATEMAPARRKSPLVVWGLAGVGALAAGALAVVALSAWQDNGVASIAPPSTAAAAGAAAASPAGDSKPAELGTVTVEAELRAPQARASSGPPASITQPQPRAAAPSVESNGHPPAGMLPAAAPGRAVQTSPAQPSAANAPPASTVAVSSPRSQPTAPAPRPELQAQATPVARGDGPRAMTAEQLCPDSNFFTRPMCLHRQCQNTAYAALPVCVENAARLRNENRANTP